MRSLFTYEPMVSRRVDLVVVLALVGGATLSLLVRHSEFWFLDLWIGAALAMPFGLLLGILWERSRPEYGAISFSDIAWVVVLSVILASAAAHLIFRTSATKERIAELRGLPENSLVQIEIYEPFDGRHIMTIDDRDVLSSFVRAVRDAQIVHPGKLRSRERIGRNWYLLTLEDGQQFWLNVRGGPPGIAYGMFITVTSNAGSVTMTNDGDFRSAGLAAWVKEHVLQQAQ